MNLETGRANGERVHDQSMEIPQINRSLWGQENRYGYSLSNGTVEDHMSCDGALAKVAPPVCASGISRGMGAG